MAKSLGIANYYLGVVKAVTPDDDDRIKNDKEWHEIIIDIPGVIQGVTAFPFRDELDEPKIDDKVLVLDVDPLYHSYFLYRKLKEDGFIGFRSSGKMVSITPDEIVIGVFGPNDNDEYPEYKEDEIRDCDPKDDGSGDGMAYLKMTKEGDIDIKTKGKCTINIAGNDGNTITIKKDSDITIEGDSKITIKRDSNIKVEGNTKLDCDGNIDINGGGSGASMSSEPVPYGNELKTQLENLQKRIDTVAEGVNSAITQSAPCPMDGGATLKATMLTGWMPSYIKLQIPGAPKASGMFNADWSMCFNSNVKTSGGT